MQGALRQTKINMQETERSRMVLNCRKLLTGRKDIK
jgi:hypothetical protein